MPEQDETSEGDPPAHPAAAESSEEDEAIANAVWNLGLNEQDDLKRVMQEIDRQKGPFDSKSLARKLPNTARDLREGKVSAEQVAESLGAAYDRLTLFINGDNREMDLLTYISHRITIKTVLPSMRRNEQRERAGNDDPEYDFSCDLEAKVKEVGRGSPTGQDPRSSSTANFYSALKQTCEAWAERMDQQFFNGRRGSFLSRCPTYRMSLEEFGRMFDDFFVEANYQQMTKNLNKAEDMKQKLLLAAQGISNGVLDTFKTCWECGAAEGQQDLQKCGRCTVALYCRRDCQVRAWKSGHNAKCALLKKHDASFRESLRTVDEAHERGGIIHGIHLSDQLDYRLMKLMLVTSNPYSGTTAEAMLGPAMKFFYENLGRVARGVFWFYPDSDSLVDYKEKLERRSSTDNPLTEYVYFIQLSEFLCYDFFGFAADHRAPDPTAESFKEGVFFNRAKQQFGMPMPAERFIELYKKGLKSEGDEDCRKKTRRQFRDATSMELRKQFHK
jgi:hypothetical protein